MLLQYKGGNTRDIFKRTLFELDNGKCHICCKPIKFEDITFDHIIPRSLATEVCNDYWNLRIAHKGCNSGRKDGRYPGQLRLALPFPEIERPESNRWVCKAWLAHIERLEQTKASCKKPSDFWRQYKRLKYASQRS